MIIDTKISPAILIAVLLFIPEIARSQNATDSSPHVPLQKTIGQSKNTVVPSLIVMHSRGATLNGNTLKLEDVGPNAIIFADRPVRSAGHALTSDLLEEWSPSNKDKDSFTIDPPNATVSVFSKDGSKIRDAVVVLKSPKLDGDNLTFAVDILEGDLKGADGPASIFIDIIGRPLTPYSYAGAARRMARRGAFYAGVAAGVAAARAHHYYPYYYHHPRYYRPYYYHSRCGYYPYPPCF